jgi:putative Mn2+ efflux pump MntP
MIHGGCTLIGIGLGLLFSGLVNWSLGMPSGILIGIGLGMVINYIHAQKTNEDH